jgi:hypothetical protein
MRKTGRRGTSIRIFLADGTPEGLRVVEKSNWTGRALMTSRTLYPEVRQREEFERPAVYLLRGPAEGQGFDSRIYIGEADAARTRIDSHVRAKDFWTSLILFTSKDENLNKAHVRYLESRLLARAHEAKRAEIDNTNVPQAPALSEADRADAESFLEDMLLIYPVLGVSAFDLLRKPSRGDPRLLLKGKDTEGEGRETPEGFVVYEGSLARADLTPSIQEHYKAAVRLREGLQEQGILVPVPGGLRMTRDYLFGSPSTAAAVLLGRTANGRIEWKDKQAQTLKEIQEEALGKEEAITNEQVDA